tara:strand:- start:139 stop:1590 length:1452 start_codon:yes stop_codon:yes gene_type:complete
MSFVILYDIFERARFTSFFYSNKGILPIYTLYDEKYMLNKISLLTEPKLGNIWPYIFFGIGVIFTLTFMLGWYTRLSNFILWIVVLSYNNRNPLINTAGDSYLRIYLFWSMFLPMGVKWSIDKQPVPNNLISNGSTFAFKFSLMISYVCAAIEKMNNSWNWSTGNAVETLMHSQWFIPHYISKVFLAYPSICKFLSYSTIYYELVGTFLLFHPNEAIQILSSILFISFHLGLASTMNLGIFPYVCMAYWISTFPSIVWPLFKPKIAQKQKIVTHKFSAFFVLFVIIPLHIARLPQFNITTLNIQWQLIRLTGLSCRWNMFAPEPFYGDGWFRMPSILKNGTQIDLIPFITESGENIHELWATDEEKLSWEKYLPEIDVKKLNSSEGYVKSMFYNYSHIKMLSRIPPSRYSPLHYRWSKYLLEFKALKKDRFTTHGLTFGRSICFHFKHIELKHFRIVFMSEFYDFKNKTILDIEPKIIWRHFC